MGGLLSRIARRFGGEESGPGAGHSRSVLDSLERQGGASLLPLPDLSPQDRAALGALSPTQLSVLSFEQRNRFLNPGVVSGRSGIGTQIVEVLGFRSDPSRPGDRADIYLRLGRELSKELAAIKGEVLTVDFVVSSETLANKEGKQDRFHAVVTYRSTAESENMVELRKQVEPSSDADRDARRATLAAGVARRGVLTKNGLLFVFDRQIHYVDGSHTTYQRNNLRYSIDRSDLIFDRHGKLFEPKKMTHALVQDFHIGAERPTQEYHDAYVFKAKPGIPAKAFGNLENRLGEKDGMDPVLDDRSRESIESNAEAARGIRLPDGSTVRIVQFRPSNRIPPNDIHAHFTNLLADVADAGDVKEVLGFDYARPWGRHDKMHQDTTYPYFYPVCFMRTIDGEHSDAGVPDGIVRPLLSPAEYRAYWPSIDSRPQFDGVVHSASGYGAAVIEEFTAPIQMDGSMPTAEEQHLNFLKTIYSWCKRQEELGRKPKILATSFALDDAEFTRPNDRQYRRRLRIYFRDENVELKPTWEPVIYPDKYKMLGTPKEYVSARIAAEQAAGLDGYGSGEDRRLFVMHQWAPPPGPEHISVREASLEALKQFREIVNQNPGIQFDEFIPLPLKWEPQEGFTGASYTDATVLRARVPESRA